MVRHFYPRSPCGERPAKSRRTLRCVPFLSTLSLRRATRLPTALRTPHQRFLSTLSLRRATPITFRHCTTYLFLSTLSLRRATGQATNTHQGQQISIHALLAESDRSAIENQYSAEISIHALLAESDLELFLYYQDNMNFYPRSPCGERRVTVLGIQHRVGISIHALLAESDETSSR